MTETNSSLTTFRRCPREYALGYGQRLELDTDEVAEPLSVGHTWHKAFEAADSTARLAGEFTGLPLDGAQAALGIDGAAYDALRLHAPSRLWNEKLRRLYAAHRWYWHSQPLKVIEPEHTFKVGDFEGQIDGIVELDDGRRGIIERKTSGEDIAPAASYWDRLRLDTQVGLYFLAAQAEGWKPAFILYDVVRKPTIIRKNLTKADMVRLRAEVSKNGQATYYQELFSGEQLEEPFEEGRESIELYGARLTADIGNRPEFYFQRREIHRTTDDFALLLDDIHTTVDLIGAACDHGFPRNPDACNAWGRPCRFFGFCSNNAYPDPTAPPPAGFRRREHLHPELA